MHTPENLHLWALFAAGHGLHVLKRASLSTVSRISGTKSRVEWMRTNALNLVIRFFVNAAAFSYWIAHPDAADALTKKIQKSRRDAGATKNVRTRINRRQPCPSSPLRRIRRRKTR